MAAKENKKSTSLPGSGNKPTGLAADKFTADMFGLKVRGRRPTGRAMSSSERSKRHRDATATLKLKKDRFRAGLEAGRVWDASNGDEGLDQDVAWHIGCLVGRGVLPIEGQIKKLVEEVEANN